MTGINIDPKSLRLAKAAEMLPGKVFYKLNDDGTYSRCCIEPDELIHSQRRFELKGLTTKLSKENKLYFRRDQPGEGFN